MGETAETGPQAPEPLLGFGLGRLKGFGSKAQSDNVATEQTADVT